MAEVSLTINHLAQITFLRLYLFLSEEVEIEVGIFGKQFYFMPVLWR